MLRETRLIHLQVLGLSPVMIIDRLIAVDDSPCLQGGGFLVQSCLWPNSASFLAMAAIPFRCSYTRFMIFMSSYSFCGLMQREVRAV